MKKKTGYQGKIFFINSELTRSERQIQKVIRDRAREDRNNGAIVKIRYQKLEINGKLWEWDYKTQCLKESKNKPQKTVDNNIRTGLGYDIARKMDTSCIRKQ